MPLKIIKAKRKELTPQKSIMNPIFGSKNVLTNSQWEFVSLWLKKEKKYEALLFWEQAREFRKASQDLAILSSPVVLYYSFMNATKALLSSKGINYDPYHGLTRLKLNNSRISLDKEGIVIKKGGVLPSLSKYLGEKETATTHTLRDLFFNLPYIHRTYCLSFATQTEMFVPVKDARFMLDTVTNHAHLYCLLSENFSTQHVANRLPVTFEVFEKNKSKFIVRSTQYKKISSAGRPTSADLRSLVLLNKEIREHLFYINGSHPLWYIKSNVAGPKKIDRFPLVLTLGAMHHLSELCRYKPMQLRRFLESDKNWLISEFIQQSPDQFLDEICSEITGYQFLQPNIRIAT